MQDVSVLHNVVLAFKPELAGIAGTSFAIEADIVVIGDGFGPDEALLEICVNDPGRLRRPGPLGDGPGAGFLGTDGEIGHEMEQLITGTYYAVEARLGEADRVEIVLLFGSGQDRDLAFDLGRYHHRLGLLFSRAAYHLGGIFIALVGGGFLDIADIKHRLRTQEAQHAEGLFLLRLALDQASGFAFLQQRQRTLDEIELLLGFLVGTAQALFQSARPLFQAVEIGQHQFCLDRLDIADRIDTAFDMGDIAILETAHHMGDGIDFADIGEELVAESFALGGAAHQARNIDESEPSRDDLGALAYRRQPVEARIGNPYVTDIGLDGAEGIVRRLGRRRLGEGVEQSRFADIRQADNAAFETHYSVSFFP